MKGPKCSILHIWFAALSLSGHLMCANHLPSVSTFTLSPTNSQPYEILFMHIPIPRSISI